MTLNGHFALESVSGSASNGLAFCLSDKTLLKFADLCIYCPRQKSSAGTLVTGVGSRQNMTYIDILNRLLVNA